jgi:hypothetical protein
VRPFPSSGLLIVGKTSKTGVGLDAAVEVMRAIEYTGIKIRWISRAQLAVAHERYGWAAATGATVRVGLSRHACVPGVVNRIVSR